MEMSPGGAAGRGPEPQRASWILPGRPPGGLPALAAVVRDRWLLAVVIAVLVVAAGVGFSKLRAESYKAESLLIASPSSAPAISECGLDVINGGGGLTRDVETLARLVKTPDVARRARAILHSPLTPEQLLAKVDAVPVGQSYLVAITGTSSKPGQAAAVANAFARGTVAGRGGRFNRQVLACRKRLEASLPSTVNAAVKASLVDRIAQLRALEGGGDPTVGIDTRATPPAASSGPGLLIVLLASLAGGIALGLGGAALAAALARRIDSERQLRQDYALPIVARVPARHGQHPVAAARSSQLAPWAAEAYRRVRQRILASSGRSSRARSVLFTSASRGEGRTTAAINTSVALIETGQRVLLIDLDLRHPHIAGALGIASRLGVHDVLERGVALPDAVNSVPVHSGTLDVLLALPTDADLVDQVPPAVVRGLIATAQKLGYDVIVFDAPELGNVSDALSIATEVDDIFVVVWRKRTLKSAMASLARTCADHDITPRGFLIMGAKDPTARGGGDP
jgi:polysaccharide biosynthesis transport protein